MNSVINTSNLLFPYNLQKFNVGVWKPPHHKSRFYALELLPMKPQIKQDTSYEDNIIKAIEKELNAISDELYKELMDCKVDISEKVPPPEIAWQIKEKSFGFKIVGTLGNFTMIKGKAKSKKSYLVNMIISAALSESLLHDKLSAPLKSNSSKVLYFDTEQSMYHLQRAVERITEQTKDTKLENLETYNLRKKSPTERLELVEYGIKNTPNLGFVVIDGVRDLITSINDEAESSNMATKLLEWTEVYNIHIIVVLHENPGSDKARGHIGTELMNKAETVLSVTIDKEDPNMSIVKAEFCRNEGFEPFVIEISNDGKPSIAHDYIFTESKRQAFDVCSLNNDQKYLILKDAFTGKTELNREELMNAILESTNKFHRGKKGRGRNKIIQIIKDGVEDGLLIQDMPRKPFKLGSLSV